MKNQYEDFDEFISWLKEDGLKPRTSERLWRKKIFSNLQGGHKKSLANYDDFLLYKKLNSLLNADVVYKDINSSVCEVITENLDCVLVMKNRHRLRIQLGDIDDFIENYMQEKEV